MPDEDTTNDGDQTAGGDDSEKKEAFSSDALSPEAREYIRKQVQSESDRKAALQTAAELRNLQTSQADAMRQATAKADQDELTRLASEGAYEEIGKRVAGRLSTQSVREAAVVETAEIIEAQLVATFSKTLGAEAVEEIRGRVTSEGGAHAEFAQALATATAGKTRAEEIQAEVQAALVAAGVVKRDEDAGASKAAAGGTGHKPSSKEELEWAYIRGEISREDYEAAKKAG